MAVTYAYSNSETVWNTWTATGYSNTTTVNLVWDAWCGTSTTITQSLTQDVWGYWTANDWATIGGGSYTVPLTEVVPLTEEQQAEVDERRRVAAIAAEERRLAVAAAKEKARILLLECLEDDQKEELEKDGYFHVETRNGTRRYRLRPGGQPVRVHGEDGRHWAYCIHPDFGYPEGDVVLAQKLLLESDEEEFLRIANARLTTV